MDKPCSRDPVARRFRALLDEVYGDRLVRAVLFGSRARGDAGRDSDYDIAVFLRDVPDRWGELDRLADLSTAFLDESGAFVHATPFQADAYDDARMPWMHEIRAEGVEL